MYKSFFLGGIIYCISSIAIAQPATNEAGCPLQATSQNTPPRYPANELREGIGGIVRLRVAIDACGRPVDITIKESSGNENLDSAALGAVLDWMFTGNQESSVVIVPVEFVPETKADSENPRHLAIDSSPHTVIIKGDYPQDFGLGVMDAYVPDDRPIGASDVNSAIKLIDQYCLLDAHEIEDGFKGYVTYGITDFSEWWVFSEDHSMGPSIVRKRFFLTGDRGYMKTAYLCESKKEDGCRHLQAVLESIGEQKMLPPPPIPDRLPGITGKEKDMIGCK